MVLILTSATTPLDTYTFPDFGFLVPPSSEIISIGGAAIRLSSAGAQIGTVAGFLYGANSGIIVEGIVQLHILSSAQVNGGAYGIVLSSGIADNSRIMNAGTISGDMAVVTGYLSDSSLRLTNTGSIIASTYGLRLTSFGETTVVNSGVIMAGEAAFSTVNSTVNIRNTGEIIGDILLDGQDDRYDGRGGTVEGVIEMGAGNDTVLLGSGFEEIDGGIGIDTLDFSRHATGITLSLDGSLNNNGTAAGDLITGFENLIGSRFGADRLTGDGLANVIDGLAGADTLNGGSGNDTLTGGAGSDRLTGGNGADVFVFDSPDAGFDTITDYTGGDRIQISAADFGAGLVAGGLAAGRFVSGVSNAAGDANDRFIYRTTDSTLWFDRDGSGAAAPVKIADFQDGAVLDASHFTIF